jgi:hypothetical protein
MYSPLKSRWMITIISWGGLDRMKYRQEGTGLNLKLVGDEPRGKSVGVGFSIGRSTCA